MIYTALERIPLKKSRKFERIPLNNGREFERLPLISTKYAANGPCVYSRS